MKVSAKQVICILSCILLTLLLLTITTQEYYASGVIRRKHGGIEVRYAWNRPTARTPNLDYSTDDVPSKSDAMSAANPSNAWRDGKKVVIFARMRTGSSFVGSIFGMNPEFYYSWEPFELYPVKFKKIDRFYTHVSSVASTILLHLLNCRFDSLLEDIWQLYDEEGIKDRTLYQWKTRLCTFLPGKCPTGASNLSSYCDSFKHSAVKLISVQNISTLIPLMLQDIKVISVFRDPRSILASLMKMYPKLYKDQAIWKQRARDICLDMLKNYNDALGFSQQNSVVAKNLALLRFEDVAFDTKTTVEKMYEFVGLGKVPEVVWSFLDNATHTYKTGAFSVYRKSSEVPYKWIKALTWKEANSVQDVCSVVMKKLGYEAIRYERFRKAKALFVNGSFDDRDDTRLSVLKHWRIKGGINSLDTLYS